MLSGISKINGLMEPGFRRPIKDLIAALKYLLAYVLGEAL
jgi:hypothetical protein